MNGFYVGFRQVFMAGTALMGHLCHELVLFDFLDLVSGMTVFTIGEFFVCFGNGWTVNAGDKIFINAFVARGAGCREVLVMNS